MDWAIVASRVKSLRERCNLTQEDLAEIIGRHRVTIARLEKSTGQGIRESTLHLVAKALGVTFKQLTGDEGMESNQPLAPDPVAGGYPESKTLAMALSLRIISWESMMASNVPLGEILVANRLAHELQVSLEAEK